jgi:hypothetical protein
MLLAAALICALLFGACLSACGVAMVSVVAEGSPNIVAPVPLILPLAALRLVPDEMMDEAALEEMDRFGAPALAALGAFARALANAEDAVLVKVTDDEEEVLVAKEGDDLVVRVHEGGDDGARVLVRTPIEALENVAGACEAAGDGRVHCHPRRMAEAFLTALRGAEVAVREGDTRVGVTVW